MDETVSPQNGALSIRINIPVPPSRGLTLPFAFTYDSNSAGLQPIPRQTNQLQWQYPQGVFAGGTWSNSLPQLTAIIQNYLDPTSHTINPCYSTTGYIFRDTTGGRHSLALSALVSSPPSVPSCSDANGPGQAWTNFPDGGDDFYRAHIYGAGINPQAGGGAGIVTVVDASGTVYTFGTDPNVGWNCYPGNSVNYNSGTIIYPTAYSMPNSIEDRNGNLVAISQRCAGGASLSISDTTGRTALSFQTSGVIGTTTINSVTVSGSAQPYSLTYGGAGGAALSVNATAVLSTAGTNCTGVPAWSMGGGGLTAMTLPNGKQYQFTYDPTYGLLSKITYPGGGYVSYTWGMNPQSAAVAYTDTQAYGLNDCSYRYDKPAVMHRYVSFDGQTIALQQDFSYSTTWSAYLQWSNTQTTVTTHDLVRGTSFQTVYTYLPIVPPTSPNTRQNFWDSQLPVESTITYKDTNGQVLRTVTKTWFNADEMNTEAQTLDSGQTSSVSYTYGPGHTITDKKEFDYGQSTATRETTTTYQAFANTPIYPSAPSIFNKPCQSIIYGNGSRVAESDYYYDASTSTTPCSAATTQTLPGTGIYISHDESSYGTTASVARGNQTKDVKQCFQGSAACGSGSPTTSYAFDETGQVTSSTDPNGKITQYYYADSYTILSGGVNASYTPGGNTNAFLTKIIDPLTHSQNFKYDFNTGQLTVVKDQNALSTTYLYNDPLARPTLTIRPDGGQTTVAYNDTAHTDTTSKAINSSQPW